MYDKVAVNIGINKYPNPANRLNGCVPDAKLMRRDLMKKFNFDKSFLLLDSKATYERTVNTIESSLKMLNDGGHWVFTVSSHGTTVPDRNGDEKDKRDEAICLYDRILIDDVFRKILLHAPHNMKMTIITDCCHSGTITRGSYIRKFGSMPANKYAKPRYLPPNDDSFAMSNDVLSSRVPAFIPQEEMNEVLITGCMSHEFSYDAVFNGKYNGALTYNLSKIFNKYQDITYNQLMALIKAELPSTHYPQTPQLEGSEANKKRIIFS